MFKFVIMLALTFFFSNHGLANATEDYVRKNAIQLNLNDLTPILSSISKFKVITIGEMHGSKEAPQFAFEIFLSLRLNMKNIVLGIEVPEEDQTLIDKFIQSKDRSILKKSKFFTRNFQDGRSSDAMVKLLEDLPKDARVICFDSPNTSSGQERDQKMAENIIKSYQRLQPDIFVILAGNIHSGIEIGTPFDPKYQPMSYLLHALPHSPIKSHQILAIRIRYASGNIWACMGTSEADCKIHQVNPQPTSYSSAVSYEKYFLTEPLHDGYNATLFYRTLTASPPAF